MEFMLLFAGLRGGSAPEPAGFAEMKKFAGELASRGRLRRGAPLDLESAGARIRVRDGKALVTDGPFAEAKEAVGGYGLVRAADRAEAIELAKRYPHARWGPVEVREILFFDPV